MKKKTQTVIRVAGKDVIVDAKVLPLLSQFYLSFIGSGYVKCSLKGWKNRGTGFYLHRFVLGVHDKPTPDLVVDHINQDKLDNRRSNLRLTTKTVNALNTGQVHKNYSYHSTREKWVAEIRRGKVRLTKDAKTEAEAKEHVKYLLSHIFSLPAKSQRK